MFKHTLFLLFFLITSIVSFSQVDIKLGAPYPVIDASLKDYFYKGGEILTVKKSREKIIIQKLNTASLSFIKVKVYEDFPEDYSIENITEFNDRYYVFYSLWDKPNESQQLFVREIDFTQGAFIGNGKLLMKVKGRIGFSFNYSIDDINMLVQYRLKPEIRDDDKSYDIIGLSVFDNNLNPVSKKEVKMPYTEKKMNNLDYSVDSEGNAYILTTVYEDNTTKVKGKDGKANFHIELLRISANSKEVVATPVVVKDKFINKIWLYENSKDYMVCAGYYNNGRDLNDANGVFLFKVDKRGMLFDVSSYEIPVEVLNQYVSKRTQDKNTKRDADGKAEFQDLELRELLIQEDGSLLLVGEQYYMLSHTQSTSNGGTTTYYTYHYNDMLVTKIDPKGNLAWMRKLPKRQVGRAGQGAMSYKYIKGKDEHMFLFLDHEKNKTLEPDKVPATHSDGAGGFLTAYKINDSNGDVVKTSILDTRDVKGMEVYQFLPSRIISLGNNEFILEVYKKKKEDILIKVNLGK